MVKRKIQNGFILTLCAVLVLSTPLGANAQMKRTEPCLKACMSWNGTKCTVETHDETVARGYYTWAEVGIFDSNGSIVVAARKSDGAPGASAIAKTESVDVSQIVSVRPRHFVSEQKNGGGNIFGDTGYLRKQYGDTYTIIQYI